MADTPNESETAPPAPKRGRKPRAAASDGAAKPRARRTPKAEAHSVSEKVKRTARTAADKVERGAVRAERAVAKTARQANSRARKVAEPVATKRVAIGTAAILGVAAGVAAAVIGRKKIAQTAGEAIDTVTGKVTELTGSGEAPASKSGEQQEAK